MGTVWRVFRRRLKGYRGHIPGGSPHVVALSGIAVQQGRGVADQIAPLPRDAFQLGVPLR